MSNLNFVSIGPPRLTTYLRYYSNISHAPDINENYDIAKILAIKRDEKRKQMLEHGTSWQNVKMKIIVLGNNSNVNLSCYFKDILDVAKLIAPEPDTRDEVALLLLTLCYEHSVLPNSSRAKIRHVVGDVKSTLIDKAHKAVQNIVNIVGQDDIAFALQSFSDGGKKNNMFGEHIKVGSICQKPDFPSPKMLVKLLKRKIVPKVSLNFEDYKITSDLVNESSIKFKKSLDQKEIYDRSWVEAELLQYYSNGETAVVTELASGTISMLLGTKTNVELENELFDFLGFDRFELIGKLLSHREELKAYIPEKEQKVQDIKNELERRGVPDRPSYGQQVTVMSETEKQFLKQARKEDKKFLKTTKNLTDVEPIEDFNPEELRVKRETALLTASQINLFRSTHRSSAPELKFPYVYDNYSKAKQSADTAFPTKRRISPPLSRVASQSYKCKSLMHPNTSTLVHL